MKLTAGEKGDVNTGKSPTGAPYALCVTWKHIKKYLFFFFQEELWGGNRWILRKCVALASLPFGCEVLMGSVHTHHPALLLGSRRHTRDSALEIFQPKVRPLKELRCQG